LVPAVVTAIPVTPPPEIEAVPAALTAAVGALIPTVGAAL
jgi:hypothetical protein